MPDLGVVLTCFEGTGTTGTTIGDVKAGGNFTVDPAVINDISIDGMTVSQGGMVKTTFEIEVLRPVKTYLTAMLRGNAASAVAAKEFTVGKSDGRVYVVGCKPSGFTYGAGVDQIPRTRLGYWGLTPTEVASGATLQPTAAGGVSDGWSGFSVLLGTTTGTGVNYGVQSFELTLNTNPLWYGELSAKTAGVKRIPTAVLLGQQDWSLTLDCATKITHTVAKLTADAIATDFSFTADAADIDFTLGGMPTPAEPWEMKGPGELVTWRYQFNVPSKWGTAIVA